MGMREIFEDAVLVYRQEADSLLSIVTPTAVLALVLLIVSTISLTAALAILPVFVLLYLATYSACLQWAGTITTSRSFGRGRASWLALLVRTPSIIVTAGPACLLTLLVAGSAIVVGHEGFWYLAIADGLVGVAAGAHWMTRHAYDQPLVIVFEAGGRAAVEAGGQLTELAREWTARLVGLLSLPLVIVAVLCAGLSVLLAPLAGAAVFLLALTVWLPFAALVLTGGCQRLMDEHGSLERQHTAAIS
jgi:hypothetical protein